MKHTLSNKDFEYFKKRCEFYRKQIGISHDIAYDWSSAKGVEAQVSYDVQNNIATIFLAKIWKYKPSNRELDIAALHEVLHIVVSPIFTLANNYYNYNYLIEIEHRIITGICKLIKEDKR